MNRESMQVVRAQYERELREVRRKQGCTVERLITVGQGLLAALRERAVRHGLDPSAENCRTILEGLARGLSDGDERQALLVALGFDPNHVGQNTSERRKSYQAELTTQHQWAHIRTLQHREDRAIKTLSLLLACDPMEGIDITAGPTVVRSGVGGSSLQTLAWSSIYHFSAKGILSRQDVQRSVKALKVNARPVVFDAHQYGAENRRGVLEFRPDYGCRVVDHREAESGAVLETFEIFKHLHPHDEPYSLGYHILVRSSARCEPIVTWKPDPPFALQAEFALIFDPQFTPVRAWWFATDSTAAAQIEPDESEGRHLELLDGGCYVYHAFRGGPLEPELHRGIAWIWPRREYD